MFKKVTIILIVLLLLMIFPRLSKSEELFLVINKYTQEEYNTKKIKIDMDLRKISFFDKKLITGPLDHYLVYYNNEVIRN